MSQKKAAAKKSAKPAAEKASDATEPIAKAPRKQKTDRLNLYTYLNRLLKSIDNEAVIRKPAIEMLNTISMELVKRIVDSSVHYMRLVSPQCKTINTKLVKGAVYAMLPVAIRDHIIGNAEAATAHYIESVKKPAEGEEKKKSVSKSDRAGLILSASRIEKITRNLIKSDGYHTNAPTGVFLTAVVQQLVSIILPNAIEAAKTLKRESVNGLAIIQAIKTSPILTALFLDWLLVAEQQEEEKKEEKKQRKKRAPKKEEPKKEEPKKEANTE